VTEDRPRLPEHREDDVCSWCPSLRFAAGAFDVAERPNKRWPFDSADGIRKDTATGAPVCVHPDRVALAPGRYASENSPPDTTAWTAPPRSAAAEPEPVEPVRAAAPAPAPAPVKVFGNAFTPPPLLDRRRPAMLDAVVPVGPPLPGLPKDAADLQGWLLAVLRDGGSEQLPTTLARAEETARARFDQVEVLDALRQVLPHV
jgi:hypothetical protein